MDLFWSGVNRLVWAQPPALAFPLAGLACPAQGPLTPRRLGDQPHFNVFFFFGKNRLRCQCHLHRPPPRIPGLPEARGRAPRLACWPRDTTRALWPHARRSAVEELRRSALLSRRRAVAVGTRWSPGMAAASALTGIEIFLLCCYD